MDVYVGTSGWAYFWNPTRSLDWFIQNSSLNAVELNASFYRFPSGKAVRSWSTRGAGLKWAIKANRLFTHTYKFSEKAVEKWKVFYELFLPLESQVDFYLFQLPPSLTPKTTPLIEAFAEKTGLGNRFALEVRNSLWFTEELFRWASDLGITWVSVDSPVFPRTVVNMHGLVYVRMHGRTGWYTHRYSGEELEEVAGKIRECGPEKVYVFFNNDYAMLENAVTMKKLLGGEV